MPSWWEVSPEADGKAAGFRATEPSRRPNLNGQTVPGQVFDAFALLLIEPINSHYPICRMYGLKWFEIRFRSNDFGPEALAS